MNHSSVAALLVGLGFLVACAPAEEAETPVNAPAAATTPPPPAVEAEPSESAPIAPTTTAQPESSSLPETPGIDRNDPEAVKAYCAAKDANRQARGSFTGQPDDADVTAEIVIREPIPNVTTKRTAYLSIHVSYKPEKHVSPTEGPGRVDSWTYRNLAVDAPASGEAFAVGTYENATFNGSGGSMVCYANSGRGGSSSMGGDPLTLVITKRTADLIEGTFGEVTFSAAIPPPAPSNPGAGICCL